MLGFGYGVVYYVVDLLMFLCVDKMECKVVVVVELGYVDIVNVCVVIVNVYVNK